MPTDDPSILEQLCICNPYAEPGPIDRAPNCRVCNPRPKRKEIPMTTEHLDRIEAKARAIMGYEFGCPDIEEMARPILESLTAIREQIAEMDRQRSVQEDGYLQALAAYESQVQRMEAQITGLENGRDCWHDEHCRQRDTYIVELEHRAKTLDAVSEDRRGQIAEMERERRIADAQYARLEGQAEAFTRTIAELTTKCDNTRAEMEGWRDDWHDEHKLAASLMVERDGLIVKGLALAKKGDERIAALTTEHDRSVEALRKIDECGSQLTWPQIWDITRAALSAVPPQSGSPWSEYMRSDAARDELAVEAGSPVTLQAPYLGTHKSGVGLTRSEREEVFRVLRYLMKEAKGFLAHADRETHGNTNMRCLEERIEAAYELHARLSAQPNPPDRAYGSAPSAANKSGVGAPHFEREEVADRVRRWLQSADETSADCGSRPVLNDSLQVRVTSLSLTVGDLRRLSAQPNPPDSEEERVRELFTGTEARTREIEQALSEGIDITPEQPDSVEREGGRR